ncbi:hypothetical protein MMC07_004341 [Pseudocyphellaria aurata]|nr:hypothetical protein [Pseudocyphellaria aurata]
MGEITIINHSSADIYVSVTARGGDAGQGGDEGWFPLNANGGSDIWASRTEKQVISFTRGQDPGISVETILGVPDTTVHIP